MTPLLTFAGISVAVVATSFISGILGMAGGMILMGALLALMPVPAAMMLHGITQMASNGWRAWLWRSAIAWKIVGGIAIGALVALAVFAVLHIVVSRPIAYLILGITPFAVWLLPRDAKLDVDRRGHPLACGVVCTALQLLSGVSGPLLDVFFLHSKMGRREVVATKAAAQTFGHLVKIVYFGALLGGAESEVELWLALAMVGLAMVGTTLSRRVLEGMSDVDFRQWTRRVVLVIGAYYLASGGWLLYAA
jgi:uncharacterized membrane protein YfcA